MQKDIKIEECSEIDIIVRLLPALQRHIANMENSLAMMRNGHFIEAYNRLSGTKDGIIHMKNLLDARCNFLEQKIDENNTK